MIGGNFILLPLSLFAMIHFLPFLFGDGDAVARFSTLSSDYWPQISRYLPILSFGLFVLSIPVGLVFVRPVAPDRQSVREGRQDLCDVRHSLSHLPVHPRCQ